MIFENSNRTFQISLQLRPLLIVIIFNRRYSQVIVVIRVLFFGSDRLLGHLLFFIILEYIFALSLLLCRSDLFSSTFLFINGIRGDHDVIMVIFLCISYLVDGGSIILTCSCLAFLLDLFRCR